MLRPVLFSCLTALATASISLSAQQMEDVVRLRGGGAVRGTIIEQIPGESLKIQASDGEVFIYTMDEIVEISREPAGEGGGQAGVARGDPASEGEAGPLPSATPALAPTGPVCVIGEHSGFPEADARTAALLVCGELRKQGVPVGEPVYRAPEGADRYRLGLHRLGQKILVRLSHEDPGGRVTIERQIQLGGIEEMISAAPRLVQALVHRESLNATVDMENVVEEEARVHRKIPGESFWEIGILGTFALIEGADQTGPGFKLGWFHETTSYSVETQFWGAGGEDDDGDSHSFVCWGIGGRYFFNKQNFSSYAGGGDHPCLGRLRASDQNLEFKVGTLGGGSGVRGRQWPRRLCHGRNRGTAPYEGPSQARTASRPAPVSVAEPGRDARDAGRLPCLGGLRLGSPPSPSGKVVVVK